MRLTPRNKDNFKYLAIALIVVVALASIVVGFFEGRAKGRDIRTELGNAANLSPLRSGRQRWRNSLTPPPTATRKRTKI